MILVRLKKEGIVESWNRVETKKNFKQNFRKIVGWIKIIMKVGEKISLKPWKEFVTIILETLAKRLWNFCRNFIDVCKGISLENFNNVSTKL